MIKNEKILKALIFIKPYFYRLMCLGFILSFLLPYVDVRGCSNKKMSYYKGYDLIFKGDGGFIYILPIGMFLVIFILSFIKKSYSPCLGAFGESWKGLCAGFSGLAIGVMPQFQFLFDDVSYRPGFALGLACAVAVFAASAVSSLRSLFALRGDPASQPPAGHYPAFAKYHVGVMFFSLLLVPVYFFLLRISLGLAVFIFLLLSLPFVVSQLIVVEGVKRGEGWPRWWAIGVTVIALAALALTVLGFM